MTRSVERARCEATDWFIRLREGDQDQALQAAFNAWLKADPAHNTAWRSITETFAVLRAAEPAQHSVPSTGLHSEGWGQRRRQQRRPLRHAGLVGAAALAAGAVFALRGPQLLVQFQADHVSGAGVSKVVRLADGTKINLAPNSAITVSDGAGGRSVTLLSGEAWFDVRHDPSHPFHVRAGQINVTDLGTKFDISLRQPDAVTISVGEGEVSVADATQGTSPPRALRAGDWLHIAADHDVTEGTEATDLMGLWRQGQLQVRGETLATAIDDLRPWYKGMIVLTNARLGHENVTGIYDLNDPQSALGALVSAHGGAVRHITPWLMVVTQD